ncbi:MAG: Maf family protein [Bacteroidota bacterium]|nr:Maf family protein [Bacteroidota bacterium]
MNPINLRKIILASSSPRRKELLEACGYHFEVKQVDYQEHYPEDMPAGEVALFLAEQKAAAAIKLIIDDEILLTADSIVVLREQIFGKPKDANDAYRMLAFLSGKHHTVFTGVCISDMNKKISFTGKSEVYMRELNHEEIIWYIERSSPYDKAGAYAVQEWIGLCKISRIEGSYSNIMGLPTDLVYEALKHFEGAIAF